MKSSYIVRNVNVIVEKNGRRFKLKTLAKQKIEIIDRDEGIIKKDGRRVERINNTWFYFMEG